MNNFEGIDWTEELFKLKKLMKDEKIKFYEDFAPELRKVMFDKITGKIKEETISPRLKEVILELRGRGE